MRLRTVYSTSILILLVIFNTSCRQQFYDPKPLEPALLSGPGQVRASSSIVLGMNGFTSFNLAGSPVKNLGLQAGILGGGNTTGDNDSATTERYSSAYLSAGIYRFTADGLLLDVYAGLGNYNYQNTDKDAFVNRMKNTNFFIQPSVAYINRNIEMAFVLRYDLLHRNKTELNNLAGSASESKYEFLKYNNYSFLQPGFVLRVGGKLKFQTSLSSSYPLSSDYISIYGNRAQSGKVMASIGVSFKLDNVGKKKTVEE